MIDKIISIVSAILKGILILLLVILLGGEIQMILNGLAYRFHYAVILYLVMPALVSLGILEWFGTGKLTHQIYKTIVPFLIAFGLFVAMSDGGATDALKLSYFVGLVEFIGIVLLDYSLFKLRRRC